MDSPDERAVELFEKLKPLIDAHITQRIVEFYCNLIERGQIQKLINDPLGITVDYKADSGQLLNHSR